MENSQAERASNWLKHSLFMKLLSIAFLILLLLIPHSMIQDLVSERQDRLLSATQEVNDSWGPAQIVTGPILSIPYSEWTQYEDNKKVEAIRTAYFLPQELVVDGKINHQIRKRGIYDIILYQADLNISGKFSPPDFATLNIQAENIHWDQAKISLGISGMSGIKNYISLNWSGKEIRLESGAANSRILASGVSNVVPVTTLEQEYTFSMPLKLNGSEFLKFEPVGKETKVSLQSAWPSPSFVGEFLPDHRDIKESGFSADWTILDLNRNYPQQWKNEEYSFANTAQPGTTSFGVRLFQTVDEYTKTDRSIKYAMLVVCLTFLIYFFFETLRKFHIHPLQYLLVGLSLSIFYLLLLSLSEHIGFNLSYLTASVATISLIGFYSLSVFKIRRLAMQLILLLIMIYGFIFTILQLEDYALLAGSMGIFIALGAVMFYSRNVDWYNLPEQKIKNIEE